MRALPTFQDYVSFLGPIVPPADLLSDSDEADEMRTLAIELAVLEPVTVESLAAWIGGRPSAVRVLGLSVGLSKERLTNILKHSFDTGGFGRLARERPADVVALLDEQHGLVGVVQAQRSATFGFGDILVARAGTRGTASRAGQAGRVLEDRLEAVTRDLGLRYSTRGRFRGRAGGTAPYDLGILDEHGEVVIAVAAKGFDSTGSKLTDAVREIEQMATVRKPTQFVFAAVDGIGWKLRKNDLRRIHALWADGQIDGVFSVATLHEFRLALEDAARRLDLV
ncbi:hypothetical protein PTW37_14925 [Arthrobacter agilis]|uniref:hypothetical protein n=1 Tax=Arthrobacter agilis TaxID=37921 RepID=UPI002366B69A|nr:hypothetical protein [Arthrobacter agilis]WDF33124.1 hypothetical protein PTW37_14925 [Arthrobacter agilis]